VMLGAKYSLQHRLHAKVKADESRQSWTVLSLVRTDLHKGRVRGPVVIHTGTNGTVSKSDLNRTVKKVQRKKMVVLVNVKASRSWTAGNNKIIKSVAKKYRHVVMLDWHKRATRHSGWTYPDGIHLTPAGRTAYARAIAKKAGR
jgi:hypothetical protein